MANFNVLLPVGLSAVLALSGCTTQTPAAAPAPIYVCTTVTAYTQAQQNEFVKEFQALPKDSFLRTALTDWYRMREEARSCLHE